VTKDNNIICVIPTQKKLEYKFDINDPDLYEYNKPKERTKARLTQMANMGLEETGIASYGIKGIVSGLYIEKVWSYSDEEWDDYINWMQSVIDQKTVK
jgi:hypothetical protein